MRLVIDILQLLLDQMGVNLGGGNICVSQHLLNGTQIRAIFQKMGRKGVTQGMGGNILVDLGLLLIDRKSVV